MTNQITNTKINNHHLWQRGDWAWLSVPKNANMMMRGLLANEGYSKVPVSQHTATKYFAIIRNPHDRVLSGIGEYLKRKKTIADYTNVMNHLEQLHRDPGGFDEHLEPQTFWLLGKSLRIWVTSCITGPNHNTFAGTFDHQR